MVEATVLRVLVVAPAQDLGPMADAAGADMVERHLDHELRTKLDPLQVAFVRPAARIAGASLAGLVRRQPSDQLEQ